MSDEKSGRGTASPTTEDVLWISFDEQNVARGIFHTLRACEEDAETYGESWKVRGPFVRTLGGHERGSASASPPAPEAVSMAIRLARFEAFSEAVDEVKAEAELRRSDVISARTTWLRIEELRSAAKPRTSAAPLPSHDRCTCSCDDQDEWCPYHGRGLDELRAEMTDLRLERNEAALKASDAETPSERCPFVAVVGGSSGLRCWDAADHEGAHTMHKELLVANKASDAEQCSGEDWKGAYLGLLAKVRDAVDYHEEPRREREREQPCDSVTATPRYSPYASQPGSSGTAAPSLRAASELFPLAVRIEKGRQKYPTGCTVLSLLDEAGEVAHAVNKRESADRVRDELLDVAAVAMRLYFGEIDTAWRSTFEASTEKGGHGG